MAQRLLALGVDELSIGDTIGVAVPADVRRVVGALTAAGIATDRLAMHFHDTRGTALANVCAALELGIRTFDASTGGTGGCPYAPGAAGNLATEDLVYLLDREGMSHGVDLDRAARGRPPRQRDARSPAEHKGRPGRRLAFTIGGRWTPRSRPAH